MSKTANMFDLQRVIDFLRPMDQGGFGAGSTDFICRCLEWRSERAWSVLSALKAQGKIKQDHAGRWVLVRNGAGVA
ncbi:hypothetical protein [uncultured Cohaesibacter sp.]|uniref:hypothetical protein n=1 Tax=uncultured Cohaesibacter sp. TaxID=1002546 RepID=UPI0029C7DCA8|nr:hypothetical protein [uncultured Cohaesibacter sp.]